MRAAVVDRYGPPEVVRVYEIPDPRPGSGDVLVRVLATAVTAGDSRIRGARFPPGFGVPARLALGVRRPRRAVLGGVYSGVIEATGSDVTAVAVGDRVCGMTGARMGAHAELLAARADRLIRVPDGVSPDDAAGVLFGGTTALHYLRDRAGLRPGQSVLVNGAAGAVGSNAVQLAAQLGATVTAVAGGAHHNLLRRLGATRVHDHTVSPVRDLTDRFDVVLDAVGNLSPSSGRRLLTGDGVLLLIVASLGQTITARGRVKAGPAPERADLFEDLMLLVATGALRVVIDEVYPLAEIVAAHTRVDTGHKTGNVILRPQD